MKRLRALSTLLSCLAVLAAGVANVAAARDSGWIATERSASTAPCEQCDDCDKAPCPMPCPMPTADCLQVHPSGGTVMLAAAAEVPLGPIAADRWAAVAHALSGLSPPPDPLPPRL